MAVDLQAGTPVADALQNVLQPKLAEMGWSTEGSDDSALAEYIVLMLASGKTQDQIAAELSTDLLGLGPDDPGASAFAQWLFEQVHRLQSGDSTAGQDHVPQSISDVPAVASNGISTAQPDNGDTDMGDAEDHIQGPTSDTAM